jgi:hypothetical protein
MTFEPLDKVVLEERFREDKLAKNSPSWERAQQEVSFTIRVRSAQRTLSRSSNTVRATPKR